MATATDISKLKVREEKSWNIIDQYLVFERKDHHEIPWNLKLEAAIFVLKRLYPEKLNIDGSFTGKITVTISQKEVNENNLSAPRFAIPDIQSAE